MNKYIKLFKNHSQYEAFIGGGSDPFIRPNVSHCILENDVHYNPKRYYAVCTYNVTDVSEPTYLYFCQDLIFAQYFGVDKFDIAYIDGKKVSIADLDAAEGKYQLTSGEHTVKFALKDPTTISEMAFYQCTTLTNIIMPNSVTNIGREAFSDCSGLTSITIPNSVTNIGDYAFDTCSNLTSVTMPSSVSLIGYAVFEYTPWWETYSADTNNQYGNIIYINNVAVKAVSKSITSCEFKEGTVSITFGAFDGCSNLHNVSIPNTVTSIGGQAFAGCESLESVNIPNGITSIEAATFMECYSLTSIDIPDSVTSIGGEAFIYCSSLSSVTINALTPPALDGEHSFDDTNNCPIYVPATSVNAYKTARGWSEYADRIQAIPTV